MKKLLAIIFSLLTAGVGARARAETEFGSSLKLKSLYFPTSISDVVNNQLTQVAGDLRFKSGNRKLVYTANLSVLADPTNKSPEEKSAIDFPELNVKWKTQDFIFKLGTDIYNWGVTDGYNPVDLVNTKNYFDPLHSRKLGAGSMALTYVGSWLEADLVAIPQARPSQLPGVNSRWLPRQVYLARATDGTDTQLLLPAQFNYSYLPRQNFGNPLQNNVAIRLQSHLENLELALYGYDGVAAVPIVVPIVSGTVLALAPTRIIQVNSDVQLQVSDYRQQSLGFSAVKTLGVWQLKAEGVSTQPGAEAKSSLGASETGVLAVERPWALGQATSLVTLIQYSLGHKAGGAGSDLQSIGDFFASNWMLGGHLSFHDSETVTLFYSQDTLTGSWLADLNYEHRLSNSWSLTGGGTTLNGPTSSPLGTYTGNKSLFVQLAWSY